MKRQLYKCLSCGTFYTNKSLLINKDKECFCPKDGKRLIVVDLETRKKLLSLYTKEELWNMLEEIRLSKSSDFTEDN